MIYNQTKAKNETIEALESLSVTTALIQIELQAKAESACSEINYVTDKMKVESNQAGELLFELQFKITTELQKHLFESIKSLFQFCSHLETSFEYAEFQWNLKQYNRVNEIKEREEILTQKAFHSELMVKKNNTAKHLYSYFDELSNVTHYSHLVELCDDVLKLLVKFEECYVDYIEGNNQLIDGVTGGHHADRLYVYQSALNKENFRGGYVHFDDDGSFNFDLIESILNSIN